MRGSERGSDRRRPRWGQSLMPMSFAASALPCPAIIPSSPSIRIGLINPNSLMLAAICLICLAVCVRGLRARSFSWWGSLYVNLQPWRPSKIGAKDQSPITFNAVTAAAQLIAVSICPTDVILKMKRFPLLFSPCCPCSAEIGPCYFFRGISLETLMKSAFC